MSELFCTGCGSPLEPGSVFCENCGTPVEDAPVAAQPQAQVAQQTPPSRTKKWPIFIVIMIVVIAIIIVAVIFLQGGGSVKDDAGIVEEEQQQQDDSAQSSESSDQPSSSMTFSTSPSVAVSSPSFPIIETSSVLPPDSTTSYYGGDNVTDGIMETAWNEGSSGDGTGEWIEFLATTPQRVSSVSIAGGYPKPYKDGSDVYYKNNRPKQVTISYDGGSQTVTLQDLRGQFQNLTFTHPIETTFIRITIDSVYKGTSYNDCCIAEVKIS